MNKLLAANDQRSSKSDTSRPRVDTRKKPGGEADRYLKSNLLYVLSLR